MKVGTMVVVGMALMTALLAMPGVGHAQEGVGVAPVSFVALTYNVAGLPEPLSGSEPATNSPLISPLLNAYDLVLLQEDWADPITIGDTPLFFYHAAIVADAEHPYQSQPAPAPLGTDLDRLPTGPPLIADGLNRLSNFPFGTLDRVKWRECFGELLITVLEEIFSGAGLGDVGDQLGLDGGATDCAAQKGFSVARTTFPGGLEVDVYNLHAEAGSGPEDQAARDDNFDQLAEFIDRHSAGHAVILGGDTNLHTAPDLRRPADDAAWIEFQATTGLVDVCAVVDCGDDAGRIDKFAFRSSERVAVTPTSRQVEDATFTRSDGQPLSDHDPVAVRFVVGPGGADSTITALPQESTPGAGLPRTGFDGRLGAVGLVLAGAAVIVRRARTVG